MNKNESNLISNDLNLMVRLKSTLMLKITILKNRFIMLLYLALILGSCKTEQKPNILFIAIDDLNDWAGCLNHHPNVQTPNIDLLASQGILFTNAHCQAPLCGPSRTSVMTGLLPSSTGIYQHISDEEIQGSSEFAQKSIFLPKYFEQNGYKTMGVGKLFHLGDRANSFQEFGGEFEKFGPFPEKRLKYDPIWFNKPKGTVTDWGAFPESDELMPDYKIANWAIEKLKHDHEKPFFLGVGFIRPHVPWYVPKKWFDIFNIDSIQTPPYLPSDMDDIPEIGVAVAEVPMMPTTEWMIEVGEWKEAVRAYLACMAFTDHYVGEVLKALEKSEYANNTIVVLWSDHGYHLGEKNRFAKHSLWQKSTQVPLIFAGKGIPKNKSSNAPVGLIDMYPTLAELCGFSAPNVDGHSLVPLIENQNTQWKHAAITTYGENNHSVYFKGFHYIQYEDGSEELYNSQDDPNEWYNIASKREFLELKKQLIQHLPLVNRPQVGESVSRVNSYFRAKDDQKGKRKNDGLKNKF